MRDIAFKEQKEHGVPEFPIQLYRIDKTHPRYEMTLHWHREIEIVKVLSGKLSLFVNNREYSLSGGDIALIGSRDMHRAFPCEARYECIVFDLNMLSRNAPSRIAGYVLPLLSESKISTVVISPKSRELCESVDSLFDCMREEGEFYELCAYSLMSKMIYLLYREGVVREGEDAQIPTHNRNMISKLIKWIEKNYAEKITLQSLACVVNVSEKYLCRFFKEYTGKTPIDYVNTLRIERAAEMLALGSSVTEAAISSGIGDMSYFSKIFKRLKGVSPRQYCKSTVAKEV